MVQQRLAQSIKLISLGLVMTVCTGALAFGEEPFNPLTEKPIHTGAAVMTTQTTSTTETKITSKSTTQAAASKPAATSPSVKKQRTSQTTSASTNTPSVAQRVVTMPFRLVTGSLGLPYGAIEGGFKGLVEGPKALSKATFEKSPWLAPVGIIGMPLSVPWGFIQGFPPAAVQRSSQWFHVWDKLDF